MTNSEIEEKQIKDLNQVGKRIEWCREQLGLSKAEVYRSVGIKKGTYNDRVSGMRAICHEEYLALSKFFQSKWDEKFNKYYPSYNGLEINRVLVIWLMFGIMEE